MLKRPVPICTFANYLRSFPSVYLNTSCISFDAILRNTVIQSCDSWLDFQMEEVPDLRIPPVFLPVNPTPSSVSSMSLKYTTPVNTSFVNLLSGTRLTPM